MVTKKNGLWIYLWEGGPVSDPLKLTYQIFGLQNSVYTRNGKTSYLKLAFQKRYEFKHINY